MTPLAIAKGVLVAAGVLVFFYGIKTGHELLRWIGIGFVAAAFATRFIPRRTARDDS